MIYLECSAKPATYRVRQRGRPEEQVIPRSYLLSLNKLYEEWIGGFKLCPVLHIPADKLDFAHIPGHIELIASKIDEKLHGKEEVFFAPEDIKRYR